MFGFSKVELILALELILFLKLEIVAFDSAIVFHSKFCSTYFYMNSKHKSL